MSDSSSLETGLRIIRRARNRTWLLAFALVPVCILTSVLLPAPWLNALPVDGRWLAGPCLYALVLKMYLMYVSDLPCPRCGKPFFGMYSHQRDTLIILCMQCQYCRLRL
jgi:hypothetical protein